MKMKRPWLPICAAWVLGYLAGCDHPSSQSASESPSEKIQMQAIATVADWPTFRGDQQLQAYSPGTMDEELKVKWTHNLGQAILATPIIAEEKIFVSCELGLLAALDVHTGERLWQFENEFGFEASPFFHEGRIYIGALDGAYYCFDATTGELLWENMIQGQISGASNIVRVAVEDGIREQIIFGAYDAQLHALDPETGETFWTYQADNYINGAPAISGVGHVLVGGCDAYLHVVDAASGEAIHQVYLNTYVQSSAVADGPTAYAGNYEGEFFAVEIQTGEVLWTFADAIGPFSSPHAVANDLVVASNEDEHLYALNKDTGALHWKFQGLGIFESGPLIVGDTVLATTANGYFHALNLETGKELWSLDLGSSLLAAPAVASQALYLGDSDGILHAFTWE